MKTDNIPVTAIQGRPRTGHKVNPNAKYPWSEWLDGRVRVLRRGRDFTSKLNSFETRVREASKSFGVNVKMRVFEDHIVIQAQVRPSSEPASGEIVESLPSLRKWTDERIEEELRQLVQKHGYFPTHEHFEREDLYQAVVYYGGLDHWRERLGADPYPGKWTEETIELELKQLAKGSSVFPTHREMVRAKSGLQDAIRLHGGSEHWARKLGLEMPKRGRPPKWNDETIEKELRAFIGKSNTFPTKSDFVQAGKEALYAQVNKRGGPRAWTEKLQLSAAPRSWRTDDQVLEDLKDVVNKVGRFPTRKELEDRGLGGLAGTVQRRGVRLHGRRN